MFYLIVESDNDMRVLVLAANDISRGSYNFARVRTTLAGAHGIMTAAAFAQASIMNARREGRAVRLRPTADPEEMSILASVMGVTQEVCERSGSILIKIRADPSLRSKTINHRRVVQEVYDRQVLHRMLGITPQPSLSLKDPAGNGSRTAEAESVKDAWNHADIDLGSPRRSVSGVEEEVESRYGIESRRQPPKKRRKTGTQADEDITFYTTDDEEDGYSAGHQPADDHGISEEEEEYDLSALDADHRERGGGKAEKRSYWLSKAMAGGVSDGGDD